MPITSRIDKNRDLTIFIVTGRLSYDEVMTEVEAFYKGETTKHVLWDFLKTTERQITVEQAEKILSLKQRYEGESGSGKTAVVAHERFFYGLSRTFAMQSNLLKARYTVMVFSSRDTAYKWFDES